MTERLTDEERAEGRRLRSAYRQRPLQETWVPYYRWMHRRIAPLLDAADDLARLEARLATAERLRQVAEEDADRLARVFAGWTSSPPAHNCNSGLCWRCAITAHHRALALRAATDSEEEA